MKVMISLLLLLASFSSFGSTGETSAVIKGAEAEKIFNQLNAFEYSSGAITEFLEYRITVRHDDRINCQKEVTTYKNTDHAETQVETLFECSSL